MEFIDYYKILGLSKSASQNDIKKAFRKQARKYHPDVNPGDKDAERKFKEINEANEVLGNAEKRKKYDQYGKDWKHADEFEKSKRQKSASGHRWEPGTHYTYNQEGAGFNESDFSDFFESIFGGRQQTRQSRQSRSYKGQDYSADVEVTLHDAYRDHKQILNVNGKKLRISVPAGIKNGQTIKLSKQGGPGVNGGEKGDLYLTFHFQKDPVFVRNGNNLHIHQKVNLYKAILGGKIRVPTMSGVVNITLKPETPNGHTVRLKGKGYPVYKQKDKFGDLYVKLEIEVPVNLTRKEKELFETLQKLRS